MPKKLYCLKDYPLKNEKNCKAFQGPSFFNCPDVDVQYIVKINAYITQRGIQN